MFGFYVFWFRIIINLTFNLIALLILPKARSHWK